MASSSNKALTVILGLAAVTGGSLAAWQHFAHARELEAVRREAQRAADEWRVKATLASESNRALQAQLDEARPASSPPAAGAPGSAPGEQAPPPPQDGNESRRFSAMNEFFQRPDVAKLQAIQQRSGLDYRYSDLFRRLKLNPETLSRFQALLVDKMNTRRDVQMAAREQGINGRENRDKLRPLIEEANRDIDQQIANLLGNEQYAAYQDYEQSRPQREVLSRLDQRLSYAATPLTDAQSTALVNVMRKSATDISTGRASPRGGTPFSNGLTEDTLIQAQTFLSPDQISTLRQYVDEMNAQRELDRLMQERFKAQQVTPNSPGVVPSGTIR